MHRILHQRGPLNQDFYKRRRSVSKQAMALDFTLRNFVHARNHILTNIIVSQGNKIGYIIKCQDSVHLKYTKITLTKLLGDDDLFPPRPAGINKLMMVLMVVLKSSQSNPLKPLPVVCESLPTSTNQDFCNDSVTMIPAYTGRFCINYPIQCVLGYVLLDSNLLDKVDLWKEIVQPSRNSRSVGPRKPKPKPKPKKSTSQKKIK